MKRVIASAGALAVGVAGSQAANVTGLDTRQLKWWNVSGSLRGFYDSNPLNSTSNRQPSGGMEVSPGFAVNLPSDRTLFTATYLYTMRYYEARVDNKVDNQHEFDARLNHKFTPRYSLNMEDSFVSSSEPEIIDRGAGAQSTFQRRSDQSGIRNRGIIDLSTQLTPTWGMTLGYQNNYYSYSQSPGSDLSALLDRVEHTVHIDEEWYPAEHTKLFIGYQYGVVEYTSGESLGTSSDGTDVPASDRNNTSHYVYIGGANQFSSKLSTASRIGVQFVDYPAEQISDISPYLDLNADYTYLPESRVTLGFKASRYATDSGLGVTGLTLDQFATTVYISVNHQITSRLTGNVLGQYQNSVYNGGDLNGQTDRYITFNLSLSYKIREHLYGSLAYYWDQQFSDRPEVSFVRSRVYAGIRATY